MRFPVFHRQLTGIVLESECLTGDEPLQNAKDNLGLVLLVRKYQLRQLSMKGATLRASKPSYLNPGSSPVLRPYNSWNHSVILQSPATFGANRHICANHIPASANLS